MRKASRILAVLAAMTMAAGTLSFTSYAEESKAETAPREETRVPDEAKRSEAPVFAVIAADKDDNVLLNNGCMLYKSQYSEYLGKDTVLKYGDVIEIMYKSINPIIPGQFVLEDGSYVKYLGTLSELYKDDIKELTVAKNNKGLFTFTDSSGAEYTWGVYANGYGKEAYGFVGKYDLDSINVGDKYECVVSGNDVVLPVNVVYKAAETDTEEKSYVFVVEGVQGSSALLNDSHLLDQEIYTKYSGNDNRLKSGDVLEMSNFASQAITGGLIDMEEGGRIKYLGNVTDVYKDSMKELTVTEKTDNTYFKLKDSEGTVYGWKSSVGELCKTYGKDGFECAVDPKDINVGDIIRCAVEEKVYPLVKGQTEPKKEMVVVLPISIVSEEYIPFLDETQGVFLKGDADLNGTVDLADLTAIAKYVLNNSSYPLKNSVAVKNADFNDDGEVNGLDVSRLIEEQLGKSYITPAQKGKTVELTAGLDKFSVQSARPSKKFEDSQIEFAVSFLKNTLEEDKNTLVSAYSAAQALGMTANGARGNTLDEMMKVIGGGMDIDSFNESMASFKNDQPNNDNCKMLTANSIWYRNDGSFAADKNFLRTNKSYYDAEIYAAPMNDDTVKDVNNWVNEHTDKMIPKLVDKFENDPVMALVNAVTFDAKWASPFNWTSESKGFFTSADGSKQDADVMYKDGYMPYFEDDEAVGFMKSYKGGRYAFTAILPNEGTSVSDYVNGLTADKFKSLINSAYNPKIDVRIPKFKLDYSRELNDSLQAMGIKDAFGGKADFSKMGRSDLGNICIDTVLQKTHIEVDEDGTKAAAATVVLPVPVCAPMKYVTLNRPFVYAIVDTQTNIPIFMGVLNTLE